MAEKRCIGGISPCKLPAAPVFCCVHNECIRRKLAHGLSYRDIAAQYELKAGQVVNGFRKAAVKP